MDKSRSQQSSLAGCGKEKYSKRALKELIAEKRSKLSKDSEKNKNVFKVPDPYEAVSMYMHFDAKETGYIEQESPKHFCHWDKEYPENVERVSCCIRRLNELNLIERCRKIVPKQFSDDLFLLKHSKEHLEFLKGIEKVPEDKLEEESAKFDSIYFAQETFEAAKMSAEAAVRLVLKVAKGQLKNGLALIRPPGHHAMEEESCGYCYFNNVALAAETVISQGLAKKVLIIDYDIHHGQGTQRMFYNRNDVLYFSIHRYEHGEFWPNLRESDSDYIGEDDGKGYNVNVPLNTTGLGDSDYLAVVLNLLLPIAYEFDPDLILVSAGYDGALGCMEGEMKVTPHFYGHLISLLSGLANGKIVVCLEGGYFPDSLSEGVACTLKALLGDVCHPLDVRLNATVHPLVQDVINNVKYFLHDYWNCFKYELFSNLKEVPSPNHLNFGNEDLHVTRLLYTHIPQNVTEFETTGFYPIRSENEHKKFRALIENFRKDYSAGRVYQDVVGYVYDEELLKHKPTNDKGKSPPELPERLTEIMRCFEEFGLMQRLRKVELSDFDEKQWIEEVHQHGYIKDIFHRLALPEKPDWFYNEHTFNCILKCVSCILSLTNSIHEGVVRAGVAIIRPPGHHAMFENGSGFCFVNNVVIAAEYLVKEKGYERVLIIDFDIHHGNGTQHLTYDRSDIMYISIHHFNKGKYFPFESAADFTYTGEKGADRFNVNIPFNKDSKTDIDYWTVWLKLVMPIAYSYNPEFVIVSAGFDAGVHDPLGCKYKLTPELFGHFVQTLKPLASGKILLALEGGYHLRTTSLSMTMCVKALLGDPLPVPKFSCSICKDTLDTIENVMKMQVPRWPMLRVNKKIAKFCYIDKERRTLEDFVNVNRLSEIARKYGKVVLREKS